MDLAYKSLFECSLAFEPLGMHGHGEASRTALLALDGCVGCWIRRQQFSADPGALQRYPGKVV